MVYLTADEVARLNEVEAGHGLLLDRHLLESAVERPQQSAGGEDAYPDIHDKAAALMHSLVANHAFLDGNKRTAVLAVIAFYGFNGYTFVADEAELIHLTIDIAIEHFDVATIAGHLAKWARPIPDPPTEE